MLWKLRFVLAAAPLVGANARASVMMAAAAATRAAARAVQSGAVPSGQGHHRGGRLQSIAAAGRRVAGSASFVGPPQIQRTRWAHLPDGRPSRQFASSSDGSDINADSDDENNAPNSNHRTRTRFRARTAYHGTPFSGWQLQPGKPTVQGEIEGVLALRFRRRIPVLGAGRTDAGVHARGQAIHFDLFPEEIPFLPPKPPEEVGSTDVAMEEGGMERCTDFVHELQHAMNRMLPLDIRIFNLQLAPYSWTPGRAKDDGSIEGDTLGIESEDEEIPQQASLPRARPWHVMASSTSKWYSYRLALGPTLWNPTDRFTRTHFVHRPSFAPSSSSLRPSKSASVEPYALTKEDINQLQETLRLYEGTHDFKAFGGQLEQTERRAGRKMNTIRTVYKVELVREPLRDDYAFGDGSDGSSTLQNDELGFIGEEGYYRIDFLLQGALYKMVRNMVGTAMEVWLGRMPEEQLIDLLRIRGENDEDGYAGERNNKLGRKDNPCKPAPPEGLTLECVYYEDNF